MRRHFALILFLLTIALPAMAMPVAASAGITENCHDAQMVMQHDDAQSSHDRNEGQDIIGDHGCIGCIANFPAFPAMAALSLILAVQTPPALTALAGTIPTPETPPPRN